MDTQKTKEERLWDYIDGTCSAEEKELIETLLRTEPSWKSLHREILEMNQMLNSTELEQPSLRFSKNVMEEVAKYKIAPATKTYLNKKIIWGIGGFFLTIISIVLVYAFTQIDFSSGSSTELPVDVSKLKVDWKQYINPTVLNIFLMADAVLGLMLLDRYLRKGRSKKLEVRS